MAVAMLAHGSRWGTSRCAASANHGVSRRLEDSVVVITGARSGAGRATARAFAEHRARLVLVARDEAALAETAAGCREAAAVHVVPTDISDPGDIDRLLEETLDRFGLID